MYTPGGATLPFGGAVQRVKALLTAAQATVDALVVVAPQAGVVTFGAPGTRAPAAGGDLGGLLDALPPELQGSAQGALGATGAAPPQTSAQLAVGVPVRSGGGVQLTVENGDDLGKGGDVGDG